jgi:CRP-like cAMP-binding protein
LPQDSNHLIDLLPRRQRLGLLGRCERADLVLASVVSEAGQPIRHAYFPAAGFISLVALSPGHPGVEVGMVGPEGLLGASLFLGAVKSPQRALVQGQGSAWRIGRKDFLAELALSAPLRSVVSRYLHVLMSQLTTSATCLRFHEIGPRLARWLLMSQDRAHSDRFIVTQEFLSYMLGVRRVGITVAAGALQDAGLIEYRRGVVNVLDRRGLRAAACHCYDADCAAYRDLLH